MMETFFSDCTLKQADIVVVQAPYELTAYGDKGTINGPKEIVNEMYDNIELHDYRTKRILAQEKKIYLLPELNIQNLEPEEMADFVGERIAELVESNKLFCMLGGEHTISLGGVKGVLDKYNPHIITVVQLDAHLDLRNDTSDYEQESRDIAHSTVMRRIRDLRVQTVHIGIRTEYKGEYEYIKQNNLEDKIFYCPIKYNKKTITKIMQQIKTPFVYLTIDVDAYDPSIMPETGTPEPGGITDWYGSLKLFEKICEQKELLGFDIVETSPSKENNITAHSAAVLAYQIMNYKFYSE